MQERARGRDGGRDENDQKDAKDRTKRWVENRKRAVKLLAEYGRASTQAKSILKQIEISTEWRWARGEHVEGVIRQHLQNAEERVAKHDWLKDIIATGVDECKPGEESDKWFVQLPDIFGECVSELGKETRNVSRMHASRRS